MGNVLNSLFETEDDRRREEERRNFDRQLLHQRRREEERRNFDRQLLHQRHLEEERQRTYRLQEQERRQRDRLEREAAEEERQRRIRQHAAHWNLSLIVTLCHLPSIFPWESLDLNQSCRCVPLSEYDTRYVNALALFERTSKNQGFQVLKIECCQNPTMYAQFLMRKAEMISRYGNNVKTKLLFHGTKLCNAEVICQNNLNWRRHGSSIGNRYGKGVSFSPISTYASHYCDKGYGTKMMFLCEVLVAGTCFGNADMVLPDIYDYTRQLRYDTAIKDDDKSSVVVKFSDDEFYPSYKIYFQGNPKKNNVNKRRNTINQICY